MISPSLHRTESRGTDPRPVEVDRLSKDDLVAEAFAGLLSLSLSLERSIEVKTSSSSRRRKTGRVAYIVNNYIAPRNNGHESFSLMRIASPALFPFGNDNSRYEAKFGVDSFAYVRFNQQMDVTHVV